MSDGALLTRLKSSHKGVPAEQLAAVLKEAQEAAATLEEELSVARRELKALGHSGVFDNAAPRARKPCEGVSTAVGTRVPRAATYAGAARHARTGSFLSRHNSHVRL